MDTGEKSKPYAVIRNQDTVALSDIPVLSYGDFMLFAGEWLTQQTHHCVNYFAYPTSGGLKFIFCLADDGEKNIKVVSHELPTGTKKQLTALTRDFFPM